MTSASIAAECGPAIDVPEALPYRGCGTPSTSDTVVLLMLLAGAVTQDHFATPHWLNVCCPGTATDPSGFKGASGHRVDPRGREPAPLEVGQEVRCGTARRRVRVAAVAGGELDDRAGARDLDRAVEPMDGLAVRVRDAVRRRQVAPRRVQTEARRAAGRRVVGVVVLGAGLAAPAARDQPDRLAVPGRRGVHGPVDVADVGVVRRLRGGRRRRQLAVEHAVRLAGIADVDVAVERDAVHVGDGPVGCVSPMPSRLAATVPLTCVPWRSLMAGS